METANINLYKYGEKTIKAINIELYNKIIEHTCNFDIPFKQRFYLYEYKLSNLPTCYCGNVVKFIDMRSGFRDFCSKRCMYDSSKVKESRIKTCLDKWGVNNPSKSKIVKEKVKNTNLEKFGVEYPLQSPDIVEKSKNFFLNKYGVDNPSKIKEVRKKAENTMLEKFGVRHAMFSDDIKSNLKKYFLEKYGVDNPSKSELYRKKRKIGSDTNYIKYLDNKISLFNCNKGHNFKILSDNYIGRNKNNTPLCTICNPIGDFKSIKERDLLLFIKENYNGEIISGYRDGLEIDIYLPEFKIGFEFNGLYWHSELFKHKNYHLDKTNFFKERGIRIIHIWEDHWDYKVDIVKSQIINILGKSKKIWARKCVIKEVTASNARIFLDNNHIQGFVQSIKKIGLYYNDELVSIMTFDNNEGRKKMESGGWNLSRFCSKRGFNVIGGASKLLNHFIKKWNPNRIVSYADKDWSVGDLYNTLGFENIGSSQADYKYIINDIRVHKSRYKKSNLSTSLTPN